MLNFKTEVIVPLKKVYFSQVQHEVTVSKIGSGWNCRVFVNGEVNQEVRVFKKEHIAPTCADMLRTEDKCGNSSAYASAARERLNEKAKRGA